VFSVLGLSDKGEKKKKKKKEKSRFLKLSDKEEKPI